MRIRNCGGRVFGQSVSWGRLALTGVAAASMVGAGAVCVAAVSANETPSAATSMSAVDTAEYGVAAAVERLKIGDTVPDFDFKDIDGNVHKLYDYHDKIVVLEWVNPTCRYSEYEHAKGFLKSWPDNMQSRGVTFIAINSAKEGDVGSSLQANKKMQHDWKIHYPIYLDPDQKIAMKFGAHMTPEMFIIDKNEKLVYFGAPDNAPMGKIDANMPNGGKTDQVVNYVEQAVDELNANQTVSITTTKAWGCNIKHGESGSEHGSHNHNQNNNGGGN